jgi:hypothetical protein
MKRLAQIALLLLAAQGAGAQQSIPELMRQGMEAYERSNAEAAKNYFATIIASRQQVTIDQRVTAYKYLGAYWALQSSPGAADSATQFFLAAIDYDPFTDLDRRIFAADEQRAFANARAAIFKVAVAPVEPKAIDPTSTNPDSSRYTFRIVSTRSARWTASIVSLIDPNKQEVIGTMGNSDGLRDVVWNGLINNARADTGLYEFRLQAEDNRRQGSPIIERQRFRIEHVHAELEDSLPPFGDVKLGATDTLQSRYSDFKPYGEGGRGLFIATVAGALPVLALSQRKNMSQWGSHFGVGVALGIVGGIGGYTYATQHRADARAVAENARRRDERARFNAGVVARNRARLDKTMLIIRPLTSAGTG